MNTTSNDPRLAPKTIFDCLGQAEDISERVNQMPRDAAILYPQTKGGRIEYRGIVRLGGSGLYYWVRLQVSSLQPLEGGIRFAPWKRAHPCSGQQPTRDSKPVRAKLVRSPLGTHLEGCTEKARIEVWPRLAKGKEVFELILAPAKMEGGNP
jgi:hypothetical protein